MFLCRNKFVIFLEKDLQLRVWVFVLSAESMTNENPYVP